MLLLAAFAFLSGVITILSPCILPVLPIALSGGVTGGKARPFGVIAGFMAGFSFFTLTLSAIVDLLGIPAEALRWLAVVTIIGFGLVTLIPEFRDRFEAIISRFTNSLRGNPTAGVAGFGNAKGSAGNSAGVVKKTARADFFGGIPVGLSLGLVWTPCVGPIMASVISLAVSKNVDGGAVFIAIAYSAGTAVPMLAVMLGGRALLTKIPFLTRRSGLIQKIFAVLMILAGIAIALQWDRQLQTAILTAFPGYGIGLTSIEESAAVRKALSDRRIVAKDNGVVNVTADGVFAGVADKGPGGGIMGEYGKAPDFIPGSTWFNSQPLDLVALKGKVVIVDFWTYSCINCIRTIPFLQSWHEAYSGKGLVIIGVHTPEFAFEKSGPNVQRAIKDLGVKWPVVLDNDYSLWNRYGNLYWPAQYFIDAKGVVRYWHSGEGKYAQSENILRSLLKEADPSLDFSSTKTVSPGDVDIQGKTPETYLGYARGKGFASAVEPVPDVPAEYRPARKPGNGEWTLEGLWTIGSENSASSGKGKNLLELGFEAKDVYLVISPDEAGASIEVSLDGKPAPGTADVKNGKLNPDSDRLYHLVSLGIPGRHVLKLDVKGKIRLFAFTFG